MFVWHLILLLQGSKNSFLCVFYFANLWQNWLAFFLAFTKFCYNEESRCTIESVMKKLPSLPVQFLLKHFHVLHSIHLHTGFCKTKIQNECNWSQRLNKTQNCSTKSQTQRITVKVPVITSYVWKTPEATGGAVWGGALERVWGLQVLLELESGEKVWGLSPRAFKGSSLHVWRGSHCTRCPSHCPHGS